MQIKKQNWVQLTIEFVETTKTKIISSVQLQTKKILKRFRLEKLQNLNHKLYKMEKISFEQFINTFKRLDKRIKLAQKTT